MFLLTMLLRPLAAQEFTPPPPQSPVELGQEFSPPAPLPPPVSEGSDGEATGSATEQEQLDLQTLLDMACQCNPTLRQARAQIGATMGAAIQAGLYPNPELAYAAEQIGVEGTAGEFHGAIVRQTIVTGGKRQLSRAKHLQRVKAAEALALTQQYRVCNDIRLHFYEALAQRELLDVHQELLESAEDAALTTRELYNVGQANQTAVLRSNAKLQQARLELMTIQRRYEQAYRRLTSVAGVMLPPRPLAGDLKGDTAVIDFETALTNLWENSPQLLAAQAKLRSDQLTIEREQVEPIPDLHLETGAGYNLEANETVALAGIAVKLPLWDRNRGTIQQARADTSRQRAEIARLKMLLRRDLADTYQQYTMSRQYVEQYQSVILPDLREAYRTLLHGYKDNRVAWPEVLDAQREYFQAQIQYVNSLGTWRKSEVLISGMLLHGGLMPAESPIPPGHIDATPRPR
ncbi:MAG: TolC family protein [Planctomycetota bacterium]